MGTMTDEAKALVERATRRASILHASAAWGSDEDGFLIDRLLDLIETQARENERLREGLEWSLAEIDGRTRYVSNCDYTAKEQRNNAYDLARAALEGTSHD